MPVKFDQHLVVGISSRALFDMSESHAVYENQGIDAYCRYQIENENTILPKGQAFSLVKKLLALNSAGQTKQRVEIILLSRNSADTGLRIFNSMEHYGLSITRAAFASGDNPFKYLAAFSAHLFLSADALDVAEALEQGYAAATILPGAADQKVADEDSQLRIAFDGDAVLFSDDSERVFQEQGLDKFNEVERRAANDPLPGGPFKSFLSALHNIQRDFSSEDSPIRTALVTARSAPAHERVIRTLREWNIRIDEALFLGGMDKGAFLRAFGADIFFDDSQQHCASAMSHVATGHVPHGVANIKKVR